MPSPIVITPVLSKYCTNYNRLFKVRLLECRPSWALLLISHFCDTTREPTSQRGSLTVHRKRVMSLRSLKFEVFTYDINKCWC